MITFKQFLEDVNRADGKLQQSLGRGFRIGDKKGWEFLDAAPIDGFEIIWRKGQQDAVDVGLFDVEAEELAMFCTFIEHRDVLVPGGRIGYLQAGVLASEKRYRGQELGPKFYEALVRSGRTLASPIEQTPGGASVWERLMKSTSGEAMALGPPKFITDKELFVEYADFEQVLFYGPIQKLQAFVHRGYKPVWIVFPRETAKLEKLRERAVKL